MRFRGWLYGMRSPSLPGMTGLKKARVRFIELPGPVRGAVWAIGACTFLGTLNVLVRFVSADLHPFEIAFFRNLGQFVFMLPWLMSVGLGVMRTERLGLHLVRSCVGLTAMLCWFTALSLMPVADVTALSFVAPLFATVGAALFLGETVRARRWTATLIGFAGALIILRPGVETFDTGALLALLAAVFMACSMLIVKSLSNTENPNAMVLYMGVFLTVFSLPPALFVWETPRLDTLAWLVVMGAVATAAHVCITRSFAAADASAVMPFDFIRLPVAAILAYVAFGEVADVWTWAGAGVIFAASVYITRREAKLAHAIAHVPAPAIMAVETPAGVVTAPPGTRD